MELRWLLEIHFHQQDEGSVSLENNAIEEQQQILGELMLFSSFACRELVNLGNNQIASSVARVFSQATGGLPDLAYHENPNAARLIDYKGSPGRKRYIASLVWNEKGFAFSLSTKGFAWFGSDFGYYSPQALFLLLRYLTRRGLRIRCSS
jgi:hypothetical protein